MVGKGVGSAIIVATMLANAASAPAATYCVHQPGGSCDAGEIDQGTDLQAALLAAGQQPDPDRIEIGPGTFTGEYIYSFQRPVELVGEGTATVLTAPPGDGRKVLDFSLTGSADVRALDIVVPGGNPGNFNIGIWTGGAVESVNIRMPNPAVGPVNGALINQGGSFRDGSVSGDPLTDAVQYSGLVPTSAGPAGSPVLLEDSTVTASEAISASGDTVARRLDLTGRLGFNVQSEGPTGSSTIEDSLWRSPPGATIGFGLLTACGAASDLDVLARNLTLVNATATGDDVRAICNVAGRSAALDLKSSIALGGDAALDAIANDGPATIDVSYSDFDPAKVVEFGSMGAAITEGPGNVFADPRFASAADFALAPGSPLIDAGDPAALASGESATDLAGDARIFGGRRDIGAYEWSPGPPPTVVPPTNAFELGKLKRNRRKGTARLEVIVPGPGLVALARKAKLKATSVYAATPGSVTVKLRPRGKAKRKLKAGDGAKVKARAEVAFTPIGGSTATRSKRIKLVRQ